MNDPSKRHPMKIENWHVGNDGRNRVKNVTGTVGIQNYDSTNASSGSLVVSVNYNGKRLTVWVDNSDLESLGFTRS